MELESRSHAPMGMWSPCGTKTQIKIGCLRATDGSGALFFFFFASKTIYIFQGGLIMTNDRLKTCGTCAFEYVSEGKPPCNNCCRDEDRRPDLWMSKQINIDKDRAASKEESKYKRSGIMMTAIEYKPHCSNCGAIIDEEVKYRDVDIAFERKLRSHLFLNNIEIDPHRCKNCGKTFCRIEMEMPTKMGRYE